MKRRNSAFPGFIGAYLLNLVFRLEWLLPALILLGLHYWLGLPILLFWIALGLWLVWGLAVTWFLGWAAGCETKPGAGAKCTSERLAAKRRAEMEKEAVPSPETQDKNGK